MLPSSLHPDSLGTDPPLDPGDRIRLTTATGPVPPSRQGPIIGLVLFTTHRGERAEAILDGEGWWRCAELPVLDRVLNLLFVPRDEAEGVSPFGHDQLGLVAAWIKGEVRADPVGTEVPV